MDEGGSFFFGVLLSLERPESTEQAHIYLYSSTNQQNTMQYTKYDKQGQQKICPQGLCTSVKL